MHQSITNFTNIQNSIKENQEKTNNKNNVKIIAVSKTFEIGHINPLIEYGHTDFGENKVQEAIEKWSDIKIKNQNLSLHLVGKLQSNKTKLALKIFDYIHSLDSEKLANKISEEQKTIDNKPKLFIQVNIGNEDQKNGIQIKDLENFYETCINKLNLNIIGLMCLPPENQDPKPFFKKMSELNKKLGLKELSMGMSSDYLDAIDLGASFIRVGSKIFGKRV